MTRWASTSCACRERDSVSTSPSNFRTAQAPAIALINGHPAELHVTDSAGPGVDIPGVATAQLDETALGFEAPSLFVAIRKAHPGANVTAWTLPDNEVGGAIVDRSGIRRYAVSAGMAGTGARAPN